MPSVTFDGLLRKSAFRFVSPKDGELRVITPETIQEEVPIAGSLELAPPQALSMCHLPLTRLSSTLSLSPAAGRGGAGSDPTAVDTSDDAAAIGWPVRASPFPTPPDSLAI